MSTLSETTLAFLSSHCTPLSVRNKACLCHLHVSLKGMNQPQNENIMKKQSFLYRLIRLFGTRHPRRGLLLLTLVLMADMVKMQNIPEKLLH